MSVNAYLLKDFDIFLSPSGSGSIVTSQITMSPNNISACESKKLSLNLCHRMRKSLSELFVNQRQLLITCVSSGDNDITRKAIRLEGPWINHLVEEIGVDMELKVTLQSHCATMQDMYTAGLTPHYSCKDSVLKYEGSLFNAVPGFPNALGNYFVTRLTIAMSGVPRKGFKKPQKVFATSVKTEPSKDLVLFSNKIFTEQLDTDLEIVSVDGSKHPCHKIFLTGNSPVFQAMLKEDSFKEGQTKSVTLENMSEKGVNALLKFLYCVDSQEIEIKYDSEICLELLEASEQYSIRNLKDFMKRVFLNKPCEWLQVGTALQLFCFSRNVEDCQELVGKCIEVLKLKKAEMRGCEDYEKIFEKNPKAAMDLCYLLSN